MVSWENVEFNKRRGFFLVHGDLPFCPTVQLSTNLLLFLKGWKHYGSFDEDDYNEKKMSEWNEISFGYL